jgi:hypothetical protein
MSSHEGSIAIKALAPSVQNKHRSVSWKSLKSWEWILHLWKADEGDRFLWHVRRGDSRLFSGAICGRIFLLFVISFIFVCVQRSNWPIFFSFYQNLPHFLCKFRRVTMLFELIIYSSVAFFISCKHLSLTFHAHSRADRESRIIWPTKFEE